MVGSDVPFFATAEGIKKYVTVFNENWPENIGCSRKGEFLAVLLGTVTSAVIENDGRKGTGTRWLAQESL
jgi:hypothetical protein